MVARPSDLNQSCSLYSFAMFAAISSFCRQDGLLEFSCTIRSISCRVSCRIGDCDSTISDCFCFLNSVLIKNLEKSQCKFIFLIEPDDVTKDLLFT